jgi:hypothetical protein
MGGHKRGGGKGRKGGRRKGRKEERMLTHNREFHTLFPIFFLSSFLPLLPFLLF